MKNNRPFGNPPPETVVLKLYSKSGPGERGEFLERLGSLFPYLNWQAHIFILNDDPDGRIDGALEVIRAAADFLNRQKLSTIYIHPFILMDGFGKDEIENWGMMLDLTGPFQREAYEQQGKERLFVLPIIEPLEGASSESTLSAARFFKDRLTKPSLYFHGKPSFDPIAALGKDIRVYIDPASSLSAESAISQLRINHVFENILERVENEAAGLLEPCRRHLVIDEKDQAIFSCFAQYQNRKPLALLECLDHLPEKPARPEESNCAQCISRSCLAMGDNLAANRKAEEGRQVFFRLGIALSREGAYHDAALHAGKSFELSASDADRAAALLHQGLCHLNLSEFEQAEKVFKKGAGYSIDSSLFAYHRGRVEFARQNYAEAIGRFREALAAESPDVPNDDLLFNLSMSLINVERFGEARAYLDLMERPTAPARFYQGICDLGEGNPEAALKRFSEALETGPDPADLSRVLFYIGTCLKELGHYTEAISALQKAAAADPQEYVNYNLLGFCFYQTKQYEKAIESLHKALKINPASAIDYASIGSNLRELGRLKDAVAMYAMALSLDPNLAFARENIAKIENILKERSAER